MKIIKQSYVINSTIDEVWKALTDPKYINAWGGGPAKMDDKVGAKFSLWGGTVWGKNIEVNPKKKLVQEWTSEDEGQKWETPSIATFNLSQKGDKVTIDFIHENVPAEDFKNISEGWEDYYLGPLKKYLESN